jgi:acetylornithine/N-succinyldiaminopimelate aminotransferase
MVGDTCRNVLSAGTHGSTFGANAICCAGANAVLDILTAEGFLDQVTENGERIRQEIISWNFPVVKEVRGQGLMLGIVLEGLPPKEAVADLLGRGLVTLTAGVNVLRLLPPLTISEQEIAQGLSLLYDYLK